jgi:hydrogenase-4 component F
MNHAVAKSTAFYGAGLVFLRHNHKLLDRVTGLLGQMPVAGSAILVAGVALAGIPPFGLFTSEVLIAAEVYTTRPEVAYVFLALLTLAFATLLYQVLRMALGAPGEAGIALGRQCHLFTSVAAGINIVVLGTIGLYVPPALETLLVSIVKIFSVEMEAPR